jgi:hypothetical protein
MLNWIRTMRAKIDFMRHGRVVYSPEADEVLEKIRRLCFGREMEEWWEREIGQTGEAELVIRKGRVRLEELQQRARENGWEVR